MWSTDSNSYIHRQQLDAHTILSAASLGQGHRFIITPAASGRMRCHSPGHMSSNKHNLRHPCTCICVLLHTLHHPRMHVRLVQHHRQSCYPRIKGTVPHIHIRVGAPATSKMKCTRHTPGAAATRSKTPLEQVYPSEQHQKNIATKQSKKWRHQHPFLPPWPPTCPGPVFKVVLCACVPLYLYNSSIGNVHARHQSSLCAPVADICTATGGGTGQPRPTCTTMHIAARCYPLRQQACEAPTCHSTQLMRLSHRSVDAQQQLPLYTHCLARVQHHSASGKHRARRFNAGYEAHHVTSGKKKTTVYSIQSTSGKQTASAAAVPAAAAAAAAAASVHAEYEREI
jgi:hypothetical protein